MSSPQTAPPAQVSGTVVGKFRSSGPFSAGQRGQAIVEFGLVVLMFALLISGMFDFGILLNARISASSLSHEAARMSAIGANATQIQTAANQSPILGLTGQPYCCGPGNAVYIDPLYYHCTTSSCSTPIPPGSAVPGDRVDVHVTVRVEVVTPLVRPIFCTNGSGPCVVPLTASTSMRFEGP